MHSSKNKNVHLEAILVMHRNYYLRLSFGGEQCMEDMKLKCRDCNA
jgi:hypothetical protein